MTATQNRKYSEEDKKPTFALDKHNYRLMIGGVLVVILGYILMIGGGTDDPNEFSDAIFSFRRITLAPIVVLLGYALIFFAILSRKKTESTRE